MDLFLYIIWIWIWIYTKLTLWIIRNSKNNVKGVYKYESYIEPCTKRHIEVGGLDLL